MTPEFSRVMDIRHIGPAPIALAANAEERKALAARFGLVAINAFEARVTLSAEGDTITATGRFTADWVQPCAVSGEDLPQQADEAVTLRFVPSLAQADAEEEIELSDMEVDEIEYSGTSFDLGEALAQSLALAIDPFAAGPEAERARKTAGIVDESATGPFAALAGLKLTKD